MAEDLVEGWTEPIDATLKADGVAINGTGLTVTLVLRDRQGGPVDVTGKVDWLVAASGTVRYSPAGDDLKAAGSPYAARWRVTSAGKYVYFPNGEPDVWKVRL
jgi:hypothetical protein